MKPGLFYLFPNENFLDLNPYQCGYADNAPEPLSARVHEIIICSTMSSPDPEGWLPMMRTAWNTIT